ncbi:MAG: sulfatase [Candidatus Solibacter usitatus]|nr:sulfatase [Candidatus Solibacter usitatus]
MAAAAPAQIAGADRPNLLLLLSDDHSAPYMGAYGDTVIKTPNLDKFASEGMRFDWMFTAAPQCVPSRTALMTGRSPVSCRMGRFSSPLPPDIVTLPELLRPAGYFTGICRRNFHLDGSPANRTNEVVERTFQKYGLRTFDRRVDWLDRNSPAAKTVPLVNEFLDKVPSGKPFFLWVSFNDPHHPWDRNAIAKPHDPKALKLAPQLPDLPGMRDDLARYYDEISRVDGEVQSILDIVKKRGLDRNTLVVFMGDNGMAFPHGKGSLYDPGMHVPFIVRWPGKVKPGSSTKELASGEDLAPTMLEAAGIRTPASITGKSFLGVLRGDAKGPRDHIYAARLAHGSAGVTDTTKANTFDLSRCVRTKTHKLIYNCTPQYEYWPVDSGNDDGWKETVAAHQAGTLKPELDRAYFGKRKVFELYDLEKDPAELNNVAERPEYAAVRKQLVNIMQERMILDYDFLPLPMNG